MMPECQHYKTTCLICGRIVDECMCLLKSTEFKRCYITVCPECDKKGRRPTMTDLTENDQRLIHAYVTDGKGCWHEWEGGYISLASGFSGNKCKLCGYIEMFGRDNPDYTTREHFPDLLQKLFGIDEVDIWEGFAEFLDTKWDCKVRKSISMVIPWLFSDYARFCALFASFLMLDSTIEEFGWKECPAYIIDAATLLCSRLDSCPKRNAKCIKSGKILTPWAARLKEEG